MRLGFVCSPPKYECRGPFFPDKTLPELGRESELMVRIIIVAGRCIGFGSV